MLRAGKELKRQRTVSDLSSDIEATGSQAAESDDDSKLRYAERTETDVEASRRDVSLQNTTALLSRLYDSCQRQLLPRLLYLWENYAANHRF